MLKNFMHPAQAQPDNKAPGASRTDPNRFNHASSATSESARLIETSRAESAPAAAASAPPSEDGNKLIVGPNIKLKGSEITDCEILVVEGRVEASMNSRDIRIAEGGVFSGKAEIDVAEVRGHFEGELTARKRLVIYSTGRVSGIIRYGALMVEEGGTISGDIATLAGGAVASKVAEISAQTGSESTRHDTAAPAHTPAEPSLTRNAAGRR
jgi:cytoskeletal protein CcmA (bactofilin family)